jgi:hypothetical protein
MRARPIFSLIVKQEVSVFEGGLGSGAIQILTGHKPVRALTTEQASKIKYQFRSNFL